MEDLTKLFQGFICDKNKKSGFVVSYQLMCTTCESSDNLGNHCTIHLEEVSFSCTNYIDYPHIKPTGFRWSDPSGTSTSPHLLVIPKP